MVELSHRDRTIKVKIVYYGPPVGGKTTNLQILHQHAEANRRGEMISINSAQDRTILFDLLPLRTGGLRGFDLRLQILAVPGQAMYATTRRLVLKGADSLVFVANSAVDRWEENLQSFREMTQNLVSHRLDPSAMPLVFQYNKRDLPEVMELDIMDRALNGRQVDRIAAVAVRGEGVLETFSAILMRTVEEVCRKYSILDARGGQPAPQWTQQAVLGVFGTPSLGKAVLPPTAEPPPPPAPRPSFVAVPSRSAGAPSPPPWPPAASSPSPPPAEESAAPAPAPPSAPPGAAEVPTRRITPIRMPAITAATPAPAPAHRKVRVAPQPEDLLRAPVSGPDLRANETLVESYAEASEQLSSALNDLREERDLSRRRLEDLQKTLQAAQDILSGKPLQLSLETVLQRMADVVGVAQAAFLLPQSGRPPVVAILHGLAEEPLLRVAAAWRYVAEAASRELLPRLHAVTDSAELVQALERGAEAFTAVLAVPFRTPRGLQALATLYFPGDAALPSPDKVAHLGEMSRALSAALELAATLESARGADRAVELALAGTASLLGLEDVLAQMVTIRDGLGEMRRRPDAPAWLQEEIAGLAPALQGALSAARSLLAFGKGGIQHEAIPVEDLLRELSSEQVSVRMSAGADRVTGDPGLLRLALRSLLEHVRRPGAEGAAGRGVEIRAEAAGARVLISVGTTAPGVKPAGSGLGLSLARRVAELHGGSLTAEGTAGGFVVLSLPVR